LGFGVIEYSRSILTKNIIVNMSREGANLAARQSADDPSDEDQRMQMIMSAIATTADPLDIGTNGMIYLTVVTGVTPSTWPPTTTVNPIVQEQYRYGGYDLATSRVWGGCSSWTDGKCTVSGAPVADLEGDGALTYSGMELSLNDGETVYAVEVFYDYTPIISYVMKNNLEIYSRNIF
jgi:hypothetical protein